MNFMKYLVILAAILSIVYAGRYIEINEYKEIREFRKGREKIAFEIEKNSNLHAAFILKKSADFPTFDLYEDATRFELNGTN